jgi:hypothetical protein
MKFDGKRAEEKRKDLTDIVNSILQNYSIQNKEKISSIIIDHFVDDIAPPETEITLPKTDPGMISRIIIGKAGLGGGKSIKPENILRFLKKPPFVTLNLFRCLRTIDLIYCLSKPNMRS